MIKLEKINEKNYLAVCKLELPEEQSGFAQPAAFILARTLAMSAQNSVSYAIVSGGTVVGVIMTKELAEEPACYTIEELLIGRQFQNRGYGTAALLKTLGMLAARRKYETVEICVKKADAAAVRLYEKCGFSDSGYTDPQTPDCLILSYKFR